MRTGVKWLAAFWMCLVFIVGCSPKQPPIFQLIQLNQERSYDKAIALAEKLIAENPDTAQAYRFLLQAAEATGKTDEYRKRYAELAQANPGIAGYHFALGYANVQKGDIEAALENFQTAVKLNPRIEYAHYMLGWIYINPDFPGKDPAKALAEWKKEEELDPQSLGALQVYTARGDYYLRRGDADDAEKDYEKITMYGFAKGDIESAREIINFIRELRDKLAELEAAAKERPDDPEAWFQLGVLQYKNAMRTKAIESWQKAVELDPDRVDDLRVYLGKALLEEKRYEEAAEQLQKAIELQPNIPTAYFNLAITEEFLGKTGLAIEHYKKYIALNPMAPRLDEVKQRIATLEGKMSEQES
jgi:tetratricopeptide (TPR) repeat protein